MTRVSLFSLAVASALEPCLDSDYAAGTWVPAAISREALDAGDGSHNSFAWDEVNATCVSRTLRWTWAPTRCAITPFARDAFLAALSHKHVLFVGDSITEKHFESLRLMMGDRVITPGIFYDADFFGLHYRGARPDDPPSKCHVRHVPLPENWITKTESWLCCKKNCQSRACCRTVRQFYAPSTNTTFTLHATETLTDVIAGKADAVRPDAPRGCLLHLRKLSRQATEGLRGEILACREAPWNHHLPFVDLLVLNVGHHYHLSDPSFSRYEDMVQTTMEVLEADFPSGLFVFRGTNLGLPPPAKGCLPYLCTTPTLHAPPEIVPDKYRWRDAVRQDHFWSDAMAKASPSLRRRSTYLNITDSTARRPDAFATDCLHPNFPVYHHWTILLNHIIGRALDGTARYGDVFSV